MQPSDDTQNSGETAAASSSMVAEGAPVTLADAVMPPPAPEPSRVGILWWLSLTIVLRLSYCLRNSGSIPSHIPATLLGLKS